MFPQSYLLNDYPLKSVENDNKKSTYLITTRLNTKILKIIVKMGHLQDSKLCRLRLGS